MTELPRGSIILADVSYFDQEQSKLRPALVISSTTNNRTSRDIVVLKITSRKPRFWAVGLNTEDITEGSLDFTSYVQIDAIYTLEKMIVRTIIGKVCEEKMLEITRQIADLLEINRDG